ncbi:hypothetical protein Slin14017_G128210 [Septoria linicola]|nr:hypothetical protein Slin14017_G128210 [Septoria linicola]
MRFIGRGPQENYPNNVDGADIVVQIGTAKTGLKAAQLMGTKIRVSRSPDAVAWGPSDPLPTPTNDHEDKALEALSQMQDALSPKHFGDEPCGPWSPYSPDDAYPDGRQPNQLPSTGDSETLPRLRREPSDAALPAYYDPVQHPYCISQQTSASAVRDMALHKGAPTMFENFSAPPTRLGFSSAPHLLDDHPAQEERLRRSSTKTRTKTRSRALDLVNLFPHPRSSGIHPRLSRSPSIMADFPLPPSSARKLRKSKTTTTSRPGTGTSSGPRASRPFDEDILDQHKTNVRRPPKGIQNWFDAYLDDDDEEEEEDIADGADEPELQELPGDDILPPAYSGPNRHSSRASDKSASGPRTPHDSHHPPQQAVERALEQARLNRSSHSSRSDSIQSSQLGSRRQAGHSRPASSTLGRESVLSLSESEYEDDEGDAEIEGTEDGEEDEDEEHDHHHRARGNLPAIRDSIFDDRNIMIANASTLDVVRVPRPTRLHGIRINHHPESKPGSARSSVSSPSTQRRDKALPVPPAMPPHQEAHESSPIAADPIALRRLNGLSLESACTTGTTDTSNTGLTAETQSSGTSYQDTVNDSPQDAMHMVAITEEERMLLDLMRQKRVAMQQMSFTEGYQLALRTEQQRIAKRTATSEERALKHFEKKESNEHYRTSELSASSHTPTQESEMRRQLSAIRKEQVDERFQMERFLDMSRPAPLSSHPPDAPLERRKPRAPSGEVLPATRYSPPTYTSPASTVAEKSGYFSADECETESARMRVKQFISSKGAVPPLDSGMKTMRRHTVRQPSSVPPSPVLEEDQTTAPALPPRSPERMISHTRDYSHFTVSTLTHKPSSSSLHDEPRDRSPVSTFSGHYFPTQIESPQPLSAHLSYHDMVLLPPKPQGQNQEQNAWDRELSKSSSQPHLQTATGSAVPRLSVNASSPFANLISAASRVNVQHPAAAASQSQPHIASQYNRPRTASSTDIRSASAHGGVHKIDIAPKSREASLAGKQPLAARPRDLLPRLNTVDSVLDARASMLSITSAGEEVLSAWAELGGGQDCLQTKIRQRTSHEDGY